MNTLYTSWAIAIVAAALFLAAANAGAAYAVNADRWYMPCCWFMDDAYFPLEFQIVKKKGQAEPDRIHRRDICVLPISSPFTRRPSVELQT